MAGAEGDSRRREVKSTFILLQKLIAQNHVDQLANVFFRYMLIDEECLEKVKCALESVEDRKNVLKDMIVPEHIRPNKAENLALAINCEEFPVDACSRELLKFSLDTAPHKSEFDALILHWDFLEKNIGDAACMIGANIATTTDSTEKVKCVLCIVMSKIKDGNTQEKAAVLALTDFVLSKRGQDLRRQVSDSNINGTGRPKIKRMRYESGDSDTLVPQGSETGDNNSYAGAVKSNPSSPGAHAQSLLPSHSGVHTRSHSASARNESSSGDKDLSNSVRFYTTLPTGLEDNQCIIEIRVVVNPVLSGNFPLHIDGNATGWKNPVLMKYDEKGKFYSIFILLEGKARILLYKFCIKTTDPKFSLYYESLPESGYENRLLDLSSITKNHMLIFTVCSFDSVRNFFGNYCMGMEKFLPATCIDYSSDMKWALEMEIFSWLSCVKGGIKVHYYHNVTCFHPMNQKYEEMLQEWFKKLAQTLSNNKLDRSSLISITLHLVLAFVCEDANIRCASLLEKIFEVLDTADFDTNDLKHLFQEITSKYRSLQETGLKLPKLEDAFNWLFKKILLLKLSHEWLFSLPLYWLVLHGEVRDKVIDKRQNKDIVYARASLPPMADFDWTKVKREYTSASSIRSRLLDLSDRVLDRAAIHPWFVSTYQYMLTNGEVVKMMQTTTDYSIIALFPIECVLFQYLDRLTENDSEIGKYKEQCDKFIKERIKEKACQLNSSVSEEDKKELSSMCFTLLRICIDYLEKHKVHLKSIEKVEWALETVVEPTISLVKALKLDVDSENVTKQFIRFVDFITNGIKQRGMKKQEIQFWGKLMDVEWKDVKIKGIWIESISSEVQKSIQELYVRNGKLDYMGYLRFYTQELEGFEIHPKVNEYFSDKLSSCVEELKEAVRGKSHGILNSIKSMLTRANKFDKNVISIFDKWFWKEYEGVKTTGPKRTASLRFLCKWSFSAEFYRLFGSEKFKNFERKLASEAQTISDDFEKIVKLLRKRKITAENLMIIAAQREQFLSVCQILTPKELGSAPVDLGKNPISDAINESYSYFQKFRSTKSSIEDFIDVIEKVLPGNEKPCKGLVDAIKKDFKVKKVLDDLVKLKNGELDCCDYFEITPEQLLHFNRISSLKKSCVFIEKLKTAVEDVGHEADRDLTLGDVLSAWEVVLQNITELVENIDNGSVTMATIVTDFNCVKEEEEIVRELELLVEFSTKYCAGNFDGFTIETRKKQILNALQSKKADSAIDTLLQLKIVLGLEGNFRDLTTRKQMTEAQAEVQLIDIDVNMENANVSKISIEERIMLEKFMKGQEMISWLREEMPSLKEVGIMCQLALISAGENAKDVDKVSFFLRAVTDFAPLIFWHESTNGDDKKDSTKFGSKELLERCQKVWENEKRNCGLLKKWDATCRELDWFKKVKNFYGSVEKSSLSQAQAINERGIYTISNYGNSVPSVESCVQLILPGEDASKQTIEELRELQSKLMLIARGAEMDENIVNIFVDILSSVEKLAEVFVKLALSGCMLFAEWMATITCCANNTSPDNLTIEIRFVKDAPVISGRGTFQDLDKVAAILRESQTKWEKHVSSKRMEYFHLNEYSIQQIMFLCHDLAAVSKGSGISDQAHSLLASVRKNFSTEELKSCLQKTKVKPEEMDIENGDNSSNSSDDTMDQEEIDPELVKREEWKKKNKAVEELFSNYDVSRKIAKAAVQTLGYSDLLSCWEWAEEQKLDESEIERLGHEFESDEIPMEDESAVIESAFSPDSDSNTLKDVITRLNDAECEISIAIKDRVKTICEGYLDETIAMDLDDHLSMAMLGRCLESFSDNCEIRRRMFPAFQQGQPNVVVCAENEIIPTILTLFMYDEEQPLPSRSEVLICDSETTTDQVERFLMRAMCKYEKSGQLLYTLAFADKLSYATSSALIEMFDNLPQTTNVREKYQLVILLSNHQSHVASCFRKYLVDGKWSNELSAIRKYLKQHLNVNAAGSAASIVPGNFSVKIVSSKRSGVGKSLYIQRLCEKLEQNFMESQSTIIRLLENKLSVDLVLQKLCQPEGRDQSEKPVLIHVDLTPAVQHGIESFAFNLFILGSIEGSDGVVWRRRKNHLYAVEVMDFGPGGEERFSNRHIVKLLPQVCCNAPHDLQSKQTTNDEEHIGMDEKIFMSETFQRPYQYLALYEKSKNLDSFTYQHPTGSWQDCLDVLLRNCCITNPSWAQLQHFCSFLNVQLKNCEKSSFCSNIHLKEALQGLKLFAVKFMIQMAQDFASPSLEISDKSMRDAVQGFRGHQLRRRWEESSHPYVFFNEDGHTMTFINVKIDDNGFLLNKDGSRREGITQPITTPELVASLKRQSIDLSTDFDSLERDKKLELLCRVMGLDDVYDPDPSYELTTDNVLKILAVYMRFRCRIPVIIMGETGCGKTRLVEFLSKLKAGPRRDSQAETQNMTTLKIHGGIAVKDIHESVAKAREQARNNPNDLKILFYDEANTTEAIYAIKEVMCDQSMDGESFSSSKLRLVAACNPYKKLPDEAIKKLEDSGLGYRIRTSETAHLFGNIPVRQLVYRVVALPPSLQPYVWDFGQLSNDAEKIYIEQMTKKLTERLKLSQRSKGLITKVLSDCQIFMRTQNNECRYVSLRDVERCMTTYEWFYNKKDQIFGDHIQKEIQKFYKKGPVPDINSEFRTLIQTVGVCYHASLDHREEFRQNLAGSLRLEHVDAEYLEKEFIACQLVFSKNIETGENVAKNEALRENIFMMVVCADMQIPLFLIGKPGSSKSLAKTIVADNMRGNASHARLYKHLKQIHIQSYQCSALTDVKGIEKAFNQSKQLQKKLDRESCTAVVVLDEIGLAEDSPNMPLKVLHPLLERRSTDLETVKQNQTEQVGFVGISNWALDPAKMNRGIFLTRGEPNEEDLLNTGREIFQQSARWQMNEDLLEALTKTYLRIYKDQKVEYYGLRDYYSMMKMLAQSINKEISLDEVDHAVLRNFSGSQMDVATTFLQEARHVREADETISHGKNSVKKMIQENLAEKSSRYLLLLVEQFSMSRVLESSIRDVKGDVQVIFGSSFPNDHTYTNICQNIQRVKGCMETGKTVILLNMADIHESLYDALNQHYVTFGDQKYVDLGLGGHLVKCRIAEDFRLIIVEKGETVFQKYPIPLVNRLEKHHFKTEGLLNDKQLELSKELRNWFSNFSNDHDFFTGFHAMIGYHDDTVCSVVLMTDGDIEKSKEEILQSCNVDVILRIASSGLRDAEIKKLQQLYFNEQHHDSLADVLKAEIQCGEKFSVLQITSFSSILSRKDALDLAALLEISEKSLTFGPLEQFSTKQAYEKWLEQFFERNLNIDNLNESRLLLIHCSQAQSKSALIACAWHSLMNKVHDIRSKIDAMEDHPQIIIAFILSSEREGVTHRKIDNLALQHTNDAKIIYADELRPADGHSALASKFFGKTLHEVFEAGLQSIDSMDDGSPPLINIQALLVDCVCASLAKVEDPKSSDTNRYLKRIEMVMQLCKEDGSPYDDFRKIFLHKIIKLYSSDEAQEKTKNWIEDNAHNMESLQEGGTFRKTIWICLKEHVSRFMGCLISTIDRCNNMDIISDLSCNWKVEMWLRMLEQIEIRWTDLVSSPRFKILGWKTPYTCKIPFSFMILDFFEKQWQALNTMKTENIEETFFSLLKDSRMIDTITWAGKSCKQSKFIEDFVADVIACHYRKSESRQNEITLAEDMLYELSMMTFKRMREHDYFFQGGIVAVIYLTFKEQMMQKMAKVSLLLHKIPEIAENIDDWKKQQMELLKAGENGLKIHIFAFKDVLNLLKHLTGRINEPEICQKWIDLSRIVKGMFSSLIHGESDKESQKIQDDWQILSLLDLFLSYMLPPLRPDDDLYQNYLKFIAPQAKRFLDTSKKFKLALFMKFMKLTFNQLCLKLLLNWKDWNCGICGKKKVEEPVILPCEHFGCKKCISSHIAATDTCDETLCFTCSKEISESFSPTPAQLSQETLQNIERNFTSFFLDYLNQYVFNGTEATSEMDLVFKHLVKEGTNQTALDQTSLNLNVNSRSYMLQIMLKHNQGEVIREIDSTLQVTEGDEKAEFIVIVLKMFELNLFSDLKKAEKDEKRLMKKCLEIFGNAWRKLTRSDENVLNTSIIQNVAEMRCCLFYFASYLDKRFKRGLSPASGESDDILHQIIRILANDSTPREIANFFIKIGCHHHGTQWLFQISKDMEVRGLIPTELSQAAASPEVDRWVLFGQNYKDAKFKLFNCDEYDYEEGIEEILSDTQSDKFSGLFAISSWSESQSEDVNNATFSLLQHGLPYEASIRYLMKSRPELKFALESHLANEHHTQILYQLVVLVIAATEVGNSIMNGFHAILADPSSLPQLYLPTMPEETYFAAPMIYRKDANNQNSMYKCPNGHLYTIGDCTRPYVTSSCLECGATIGGKQHKPAPGNERVIKDDSTQAGYKLSSQNNENLSSGAERMSPQGAAVTQFFMHSCLLAASLDHQQAVQLKRSLLLGDDADVQDFLIQKLQLNLEELSKALARNADDAVLILHWILLSIIKQGAKSHAENWSNLDSRKAWEETFRREYLQPVFHNLNQIIAEASSVVRKADVAEKAQLNGVLDEAEDEGPPGSSIWEHPSLWKIIDHPSSAHLLQQLEDNNEGQGQVLEIILHTPELSSTKYLENVLTLQCRLIKKYEHKIDLNDAETKTFRDHISDGGHEDKQAIEDYITCWNEVYTKLVRKYPAIEKFRHEIDLDSSLSMALPSSRGTGLCAKHLSEYLIEIHNTFLVACMQKMTPTPSVPEADAHEMTGTDFVRMDKETDLLPLINMHTSYTIQSDGQTRKQHCISYNFEALEKQVREKYVMSKKQIRISSLPCMKYPQDIGIGSDWEKVESAIKQEPLTEKLMQELDSSVERSHLSDVCDGVRILANTISFLAMVTPTPKKLSKFLKNDLKLPAAQISMIPESAEIAHVLALYGRLSWHKTVKFVRQGLKPYREILAQIGQESIPGDILNETKEALKQTNRAVLQQRINEMIIKGKGIDNKEWSLKEEVFPYLSFLDGNEDDTWYSKLPAELCNKHVMHLFQISVGIVN